MEMGIRRKCRCWENVIGSGRAWRHLGNRQSHNLDEPVFED